MLVVSRKVGEAIIIDRNIYVTVECIGRGAVRLRVESPCYPSVVQEEITSAETVRVTVGSARSNDELPYPSGF